MTFSVLAVLPLLWGIAAATIKVQRRKYVHWYPKYREQFQEYMQNCTHQAHAYWVSNLSSPGSPCADCLDCLLNQCSESMKSNMQSANVLLGLVPSVVGMLSPTTGEVAALSLRRPLLSVLVSFGSPAVNIGSLSARVDIDHMLVATEDPQSQKVGLDLWHLWIVKRTDGANFITVAIEYVLLAVAITNVIHVSIDVDLRTVSGWRCSLPYLPLAWAISSTFTRLIGIWAIRTRVPHPPTSPRSPIRYTGFRKALFVPVQQYRQIVLGTDRKRTGLLFCIASISCFIHMLYGTLVLASLNLIAAMDALPIVLRYTLSTLVCQAVLQWELSQMRAELAAEDGHAGRASSRRGRSRDTAREVMLRQPRRGGEYSRSGSTLNVVARSHKD